MAKHWAIAIGINTYTHFQSLSYAQQDAEAIHHWWVEEANIPADQCVLLTPMAGDSQGRLTFPNRDTICHWLNWLCTTALQPDDRLWVFFSGYGVCQNGEDYLMPVEGDPQRLAETGIALRSLFRTLQTAPTRQVVLFLDINRSQGSLAQPVGVQTVALAEETSMAVMLSCQPEQFSREAAGLNHGFFTAALLQGLRVPQVKTLTDLDQQVRLIAEELCETYWRPVQTPLTIGQTDLGVFRLPPLPTPIRSLTELIDPRITLQGSDAGGYGAGDYAGSDYAGGYGTGDYAGGDYAASGDYAGSYAAGSYPGGYSPSNYSPAGYSPSDYPPGPETPGVVYTQGWTQSIGLEGSATVPAATLSSMATPIALSAPEASSVDPYAAWMTEEEAQQFQPLSPLNPEATPAIAPSLTAASQAASQAAPTLNSTPPVLTSLVELIPPTAIPPGSSTLAGETTTSPTTHTIPTPVPQVDTETLPPFTLDEPEPGDFRLDTVEPGMPVIEPLSPLEDDEDAFDLSSSHRPGSLPVVHLRPRPNSQTNKKGRWPAWLSFRLLWAGGILGLATWALLGVFKGQEAGQSLPSPAFSLLQTISPTPQTNPLEPSPTPSAAEAKANRATGTEAKATPAQATPDQTTPAQTTPAQTTPAQTTPAQTTESKIAAPSPLLKDPEPLLKPQTPIAQPTAPKAVPQTIAQPSPVQPPPAQPSPIQPSPTIAASPILAEAQALIRDNRAATFSQAIAKARQIQPGQPGYTEARQNMNRWSRTILDLGLGRAQQSDYIGAIAAARLIPKDLDGYSDAQQHIQDWQPPAQLQHARIAVKPRQASSYNQAIELARQIPTNHPLAAQAKTEMGQWSAGILQIAQQRANQGDITGAIAAAQLVPQDMPNYTAARQAISKWQQQ